MGNQGPGTNGSEFFVVHSFANISTIDQDAPPTRPVWITDVRVVGQRG